MLATLRNSIAAPGPPAWWAAPADTLVTSARECDTLARLSQLRLLAPLLAPGRLLAVAPEAVARLWPPELSDGVADAGFNAYLRTRWVACCWFERH